MRRRLLDSMMPFFIVAGMTLFAAGLVTVVEVGAAKSSKRLSAYKVEPHKREAARDTAIDYENAQRVYTDVMRQHAAQQRRAPKPQNNVAYQMSLQNEAIREMSGLPAPPSSTIDGDASDDVLDWTMFEDGNANPLSALKSGAPSGQAARP